MSAVLLRQDILQQSCYENSIVPIIVLSRSARFRVPGFRTETSNPKTKTLNTISSMGFRGSGLRSWKQNFSLSQSARMVAGPCQTQRVQSSYIVVM